LAAVNTTTTTTVTTSTSQGIQLTVGSQSNTIAVGNFVTDVAIQPYIAPITIGFFAYNMRPNQTYHVFFDGVLVDQFCAPGTVAALASAGTGAITSVDTSSASTISLTGTWGSPITSDSRGYVFGQFNVPAGQFRTGERVLEIADVTSLVQGNDALTSKASATFVASNLNVTKQAVTLTTVNPVLGNRPVTNTVVTTNVQIVNTTIPDIVNIVGYYEPIAQGLTINTPTSEAGIYATSLDIFFKQKSLTSNTNGVTTYLCEVNNGYPDGSRILPFSTVHLNYGDISTSADASVPTTFAYESPVFLSSGKEYAFIVRPDNGDPDYFVYSANLGDTDIKTGTQVYSQPTVGTAFYGATMNEWTALQTEYIKFNLNRADFIHNSSGFYSGDAYFNNANTDYLSVYNITYSNSTSTLLPGDTVYVAANAWVNTVTTSIQGTLRYYDNVKGLFYVENSTANFTNNAFIQVHRFANASLAATNAVTNTTLVAYANTNAMYNPKINDIVGQFSFISPAGTALTYKYKGTSNTYAVESNENSITLGYETEFYDQERMVASVSNEVARMGGAKSMTVHSNFTTDTPFVSPLIDTVRANALIIRNLVDYPQFSYNEYYNNGLSRTKYISKVVTLAAGQDAQDLQVILSAHRPPGTDIKVYVKLLSGQDPDVISAKTWTPLNNLSYTIYADPSNPSDMREYTYSFYNGYSLVPTSGTITTTSACTVINGVGTLFGSEIDVGYYINMAANATYGETARQVVSIANSTQLTLNAPFGTTYTANAYYIVPPPTTAWMATNANTSILGSVSMSTSNNTITGTFQTFTANTLTVFNNSIYITNANSYFNVGDRVYYAVPSGNTAIGGLTGNTSYYIATSNSTAVTLNIQQNNTSPTTLTGATTNPGQTHSLNTTYFTSQFNVGSIIGIAGDRQTITAIQNNVSLSVGEPWSSTGSQVNAYLVASGGASYVSNTGAAYTNFKQFAIKIILQSKDSSKIPIIDSLQALALQL